MVMPVPSRLKHNNADDPLDQVLRPPPDETPDQRQLRLEREDAARKVSAQIDAEIKAERQARKKKRIVRLLLLGQSESGKSWKSTTLRQFQRLYTPTAFREERILWRAVIQLNVIRSIHTILDALMQAPPPPMQHYHSYSYTQAMPQQPSYPYGVYPSSDMAASGSTRSPAQAYSQSITASYVPSHRPRQPSNTAPQFDLGPSMGLGDSDNEDLDMYPEDPNHSNSSLPGPISSSPSPYSQPQYPTMGPSNSSVYAPSNQSHRRRASHSSVQLDALAGRLAPLRHAESLLIAKLVPPNEDEATQLPLGQPSTYRNSHGHSGSIAHYQPSIISTHTDITHNTTVTANTKRAKQEIFVRPGMHWKGALSRARVSYPSTLSYSTSAAGSSNSNSASNLQNVSVGSSSSEDDFVDQLASKGMSSVATHSVRPRPSSAGNTGLETPDEVQEALYSCRDSMMQLWGDEWVRDVLKRRKVRLEEGPGFYLNDLERVTSLRYMPSDDDVLKARLKTVGVSEYKFEMEVPAGRDSGTEWRIVDVGGSRSQRPTWVPFFDDVDAIIFLAPISGFDQVLAEDKTVNRLEDSVLLWKAVCTNKLLANVDLVLFLNKCDILETKLNAGIRLAKYVRSYGDRVNDLDTVSKYLRSKFSAIHREYSPSPRKFYAFCTSVTDTATTAGIIASVRDMVIRQHLKQSKLL
ncbi:hypothetical protein ONZ45_g9004 [Pleurotus djamor]|nr:hypothetical protein ONZ45_g9004 [Pleurotus djamor]